jgi:type VI secretion system secreted protein Hcp
MALVDMFLKLDGVDGESQDPEHKNEIQVLGFKMQARAPRDATTGAQTGKVVWANVTFFSNVEKGSAKLFQCLATNAVIPNAKLVCRKAGKGQQDYFTVTLSDCHLARVEIVRGSGGGEGVIPTCEFDVEYGKIVIQSSEQTSTGPTSGPITAVFDLRAGR